MTILWNAWKWEQNQIKNFLFDNWILIWFKHSWIWKTQLSYLIFENLYSKCTNIIEILPYSLAQTPDQQKIQSLLATWLGSQNPSANCGRITRILGTHYLHFTRFHCPFDWQNLYIKHILHEGVHYWALTKTILHMIYSNKWSSSIH